MRTEKITRESAMAGELAEALATYQEAGTALQSAEADLETAITEGPDLNNRSLPAPELKYLASKIELQRAIKADRLTEKEKAWRELDDLAHGFAHVYREQHERSAGDLRDRLVHDISAAAQLGKYAKAKGAVEATGMLQLWSEPMIRLIEIKPPDRSPRQPQFWEQTTTSLEERTVKFTEDLLAKWDRLMEFIEVEEKQ